MAMTPPGDPLLESNAFRVRVQGEGFAASRTIRAKFKDGDTRSLEVRVRGKTLEMEWVS